MKNHVGSPLVVLFLVFNISCQEKSILLSENNEKLEVMSDIIQSYELEYSYPIKPGTSAWKQLKNNEEKVQACQIPDGLLSELTTKDLLMICLEYPLLNDIHAFNNIEDGLNKLFHDFNGIRELSRRSDALEMLTEEYKNRISSISSLDSVHTNYAKGKFIVGLSNIEVIGTRSEFLRSSNSLLKTSLMKALFEGYERKKKYANYFKGIGFQTNLFSRLSLINFNGNTLLNDLQKPILFDAQTIDQIDKHSMNFESN